jgi:hypothetical protein
MGFSVALLLKAYGQFNTVVACGLQAWTNWELSSMLNVTQLQKAIKLQSSPAMTKAEA